MQPVNFFHIVPHPTPTDCGSVARFYTLHVHSYLENNFSKRIVLGRDTICLEFRPSSLSPWKGLEGVIMFHHYRMSLLVKCPHIPRNWFPELQFQHRIGFYLENRWYSTNIRADLYLFVCTCLDNLHVANGSWCCATRLVLHY